jgi:tetratricopeptide (TPR) repeat protein
MVVSPTAHGHRSVDARIDAINRELEKNPNDAARIAERGALYALDRRWSDAVADFEDAYELDPKLPGIEHRLANALLEVGEPERTVELLTALIGREPKHLDAHIVRARAYLALGEVDEAIADYSFALANTDRPAPRYYRERAQAIADKGDTDAAIASLREGMTRLGPVVSLVEPALELEESRGRYEQALALARELTAPLRDAPEWRAKRASLLERTGKLEEAEQEYRQALATLATWPEKRRNTKATSNLRERIERELARIGEVRRQPPPTKDRWWLPWLLALGGLLLCGALVLRRVLLHPNRVGERERIGP